MTSQYPQDGGSIVAMITTLMSDCTIVWCVLMCVMSGTCHAAGVPTNGGREKLTASIKHWIHLKCYRYTVNVSGSILQ